MKKQLTADLVRKTFDQSLAKEILDNKVVFKEVIIGQDRAIKALQFSLGIKSQGFNVYVAGRDGTGKLTAVKKFVEEPAKKQSIPNDWCYVNNFKDAYYPTRLMLPPGKANEFKDDIKDLITDARITLIKTFEHEDFIKRRENINKDLQKKQDEIFQALNDRALKESILIEETPMDIITIPLKNGKKMTDEQFNKLSEDEQISIRKKQEKYVEEIRQAVRQARRLERDTNAEFIKLEKEVATFAIRSLFEELEEKYSTIPDVMNHLKEIKEDILGNLPGFLRHDKDMGPLGRPTDHAFSKRYNVNVLVDNGQVEGAPVILELNPTYNNLIGRVEKESMMGTWITDHTLIRKGSLHSANGGYLIIRIEDLLKNIFSWESLKRALKNKEIVIEEAGDQWGFLTTKSLKPQPIPLNLKVILIGTPLYYYLLHTYDSDFKELFKVKADFDTTMEHSDKSLKEYVNLLKTISEKEGMLPMNEGSIIKIVEHGARLAEDQEKLSTQFGEIADVMREANHYALSDQSNQVQASHVLKAINEKYYRSNLIQEKLNELITNKQILIDITGKKVGQVNGLSVMNLGDIEFGVPNRITCSVSLGKDGVIAIEREAKLSGPIHTKGVMILTGYLSEKFSQDKPLSLNARIGFEQSYSEVEGDSASSTELYTILSNLSKLPIKQGIAVTGSVNQKGEIQAVGGVNEKIEGYFEVCKNLGLSDEQGVIIPSSNVRNLMLKEEVQEAIANNKFKIWAIDSIEEGIEILTGREFGSTENEGSIAYLIDQRISDYADNLKAFASTNKHKIVEPPILVTQ
jgi:lon-related putative ATP-dependent protease